MVNRLPSEAPNWKNLLVVPDHLSLDGKFPLQTEHDAAVSPSRIKPRPMRPERKVPAIHDGSPAWSQN